MKRLEYLLLGGLGLAFTLCLAIWQTVPGYMDADYYFAGGIQLVEGKGLTEPFLWNYLDDPKGIPHPSHTYWMPLASLLAAVGMGLTGRLDFFSARLPFFLVSAAVPPLTAWLAYRLTARGTLSWIAGWLAIFSGFYAVYQGLTETIALYMALGTLFLATATWKAPFLLRAIGLGLIGGMMHLARADGIVWAAVGCGVLIFERIRYRKTLPIQSFAAGLGIFFASYLAVMGFWYGRNLAVFGSLFPPGNGKTLWLLDYDQIFSYPASELNFQSWIGAGLPALVLIRWEALLSNLQTVLGVEGEVFLLPLVLVGLWRLRKQALVILGAGLWLVIFGLMTVVFPFAGARGGMLHSGAAFQPLFWTAAMEGLQAFIGVGIRWLNWKQHRAEVGFGILAVVIAVVLTAIVAIQRFLPYPDDQSAWDTSWKAYSAVEQSLVELGAAASDPVLVNNPPGYYLASGRPAVVIPNGDLETLLAAAERYHARYLVLEENTVSDLRSLYNQPESRPGLHYLRTIENRTLAIKNIHLFEVLGP